MSLSISRLSHAIRWDIRIQFRYGFYYAAAVISTIWVLVFWNVAEPYKIKYLPAFLLSNLNIGTFFFVGGLILFEKNQRTIDALLVTPLTFKEYILSKTCSLIILGLLENLIVIIFVFKGLYINYFMIFISIIGMASLYTLFGIGFTVKYRDVTDFIFPSMLIMFILELPLLAYIGISGSVWTIIYYFTPMQPLLNIARLSSETFVLWEIIYTIVGIVFWFTIAYIYAKRRYIRYIVKKEV